jgi:hypothetical protein
LQSPAYLSKELTSDPKQPGAIEYSVSSWGDINYLQKSLYQITIIDSQYGCEPFTVPYGEKAYTKTAFLFERGECTYGKKIENSRLAGSDLVLVFENQENVDISKIIPVADKKYKGEKIPMVLINRADGLRIKKALGKFFWW